MGNDEDKDPKTHREGMSNGILVNALMLESWNRTHVSQQGMDLDRSI